MQSLFSQESHTDGKVGGEKRTAGVFNCRLLIDTELEVYNDQNIIEKRVHVKKSFIVLFTSMDDGINH